MLSLDKICYTIDKEDEEIELISEASIQVNQGHFMAIVGPSGCGKTTLLRVIAGLNEESSGSIFWNGRNLAEDEDLSPSEIGYVPQFSIAFDELSVEESIESTIRLRVRARSHKEVIGIRDNILSKVGLKELRHRRVEVLSGGQKRRLGLALELASNPILLLCDEVTSGLDPKSEQEIVRLMHQLSHEQNRIVVNVTHSLSNLELYDSVLVLFEGRVVYHGPPERITHYFSVDSAENIYPTLTKQTPVQWHKSWEKHRASYYKNNTLKEQPAHATDDGPHETSSIPGRLAQLQVLLARRWKIFFRDRTQIFLQMAMLFGFPLLVVIFGLDGIPQPRHEPNLTSLNPIEKMGTQMEVTADHLKIGGLLSGLVMFQVILLTLMGSNNSAREIAGERLLFEKEKFAGLHVSSYIGSKVLFLLVLVAIQSIWMGIFVEFMIPSLPGELVGRLAILILVNAAMTSICLGISGVMSTPAQASLLSIYLVGFQLPLSGAVLALPQWLEPITRTFISAYWGWSGNLDLMKDAQFSQAINTITEDTSILAVGFCYTVLALHITGGLVAAYIGAKRHKWH
ncbi:MAG: ATP-binding cassette domain-containing protein [Verrucomicrobiaceae bacterium]|nr:ATP-binding cassette domain-containing protein [Verrucomicrobiaceae bacterium]